jgi:hypothetical protein
MKTVLLLVVGLALAPVALFAQERPTLVVNVFTTAPDVVWPYDMKQMHAQMLAEFLVMLRKQFDIVGEEAAAGRQAGAPFTSFIAGNRRGRSWKVPLWERRLVY